MDFASDALFDGRRLRALTVVAPFTREALAIDVDKGIKGEQVVAAMTRISSIRGAPRTIRMDNVLCREAAAGLASRYPSADNHRRGMQSEPDGSHRQRDRSLP